MSLRDPRLAYDVLPVLLWTAGPDGACDYLNDRWTEFTGRAVSEMLGWGWTESLHPDDRDGFRARFTATLAARGPFRLEFRMLHQDGEYRWLLSQGEPIHGPSGEFLGYSGCSTDVTDRRTLEQRLAQHDRAGEIAQLAGGIAHDFNNLLTVIIGRTEVLRRRQDADARTCRDAGLILDAAETATKLTRQLLAFSRKQVLERRLLDVNAVVADMTQMLRQLIGEHIDVVVTHATHHAWAHADRAQVEQRS